MSRGASPSAHAAIEPLAALAELEPRGWLVGGALRDMLLGRATADFDVVVEGDPRAPARQLARRLHAHAFELSEGFACWRVVAGDRSWQLDLLPLGEQTIEQDLALRDLTINAIAQPVGGGELVDPFGGLRDLREQRLRAAGFDSFRRDPLRVLRLVRLACELSFDIDPGTGRLARDSAPALSEVAAERVFAELRRIVISPRVADGLVLMDELAATAVVLPELVALRGVLQSPYHHLDVYEHTVAVLRETVAIERDPESALGGEAVAVAEVLAAPVANELSRWQALRFGALLHDIAKPITRAVSPEGRVTFIGHDRAGADVAVEMLTRMRTAERLREHVAALVRHHLRLGFLVHAQPLTRRDVYEYLQACAPLGVDVTVLSVADRLATKGRRSEQAIAAHLELARRMLAEAVSWERRPPRPPVRGDELARELGLAPGPELGRILAELEQASFANEIGSRSEAIERARELLRR